MRPSGLICIKVVMGATKAWLNLQRREHAVEQVLSKTSLAQLARGVG